MEEQLPDPKDFVAEKLRTGEIVHFSKNELLLHPHWLVNCRREFYLQSKIFNE